MTEEQLRELIRQHGGLVSEQQIRQDDPDYPGTQDPSSPWRLLMADGTWVLVQIKDDTVNPQPGQGPGQTFDFPKVYTVLESGKEGGIFSQSGSSPEVRQGPDGNWYQWDGQRWTPAPGMPTEQATTGGQKYREFGGDLYVEDPTAPNGLRLVMRRPATTTATDPLDRRYKELQIQRAEQDLRDPFTLSLEQQDQAIRTIQQQLASGQLSPKDADQLIDQVRAATSAGLQGTTPYQMQTDRQSLARGVLGDRMSNASSLAQGLLSGATDMFSRVLSSSNPPYNFDPFLMAKQYTDDLYGGPQMAETARAILMGALSGGQPAAPMPTGAGYMPPQRQMPGVQAGSGVEQWRPLVAKYFPPEAVDNILRIMELESSGNPAAHNPGTAEIPEDSHGLLQINAKAHPQWAGLNLRDPETNLRLAAELFRASGYQPWYNAATRLGLLGGAQ